MGTEKVEAKYPAMAATQTAREKEIFSRKDFVTNEDWEKMCLSNLFEEGLRGRP
jgi:hypothetical protein